MRKTERPWNPDRRHCWQIGKIVGPSQVWKMGGICFRCIAHTKYTPEPPPTFHLFLNFCHIVFGSAEERCRQLSAVRTLREERANS